MCAFRFIILVLLGGLVFTSSQIHGQQLSQDDDLKGNSIDVEDLINSYEEYEELLANKDQTTIPSSNENSPSVGVPVYNPPIFAPMKTLEPLMTFKPYTWTPLPIIKSPAYKYPVSNPKYVQLQPNMPSKQLKPSINNMKSPVLTMPSYGYISPSLYISNNNKTVFLSTSHYGATSLDNIGNTHLTNDFNIIVINDCQEKGACRYAKASSLNEDDVTNKHQRVPEDKTGSDPTGRQAVLHRPYDTSDIVDGAELVAKPMPDNDKMSAFESIFKEPLPEGPKEGFVDSNLHNKNMTRRKRFVPVPEVQVHEDPNELEWLVRQVPGDINSAVSGISQPGSIHLPGSGSQSSSVGQNTESNIGTRPGDNELSSGTDEKPTIPGSVGVPASREAVAPKIQGSPFQAIDAPWWRSLRDSSAS